MRIFNLFKYQIWPLPDNPRELEELASSLRFSLVYTYRHRGLDTALVQRRIRKALAAFRYRVLLVLTLMTVLLEAALFISFSVS